MESPPLYHRSSVTLIIQFKQYEWGDVRKRNILLPNGLVTKKVENLGFFQSSGGASGGREVKGKFICVLLSDYIGHIPDPKGMGSHEVCGGGVKTFLTPLIYIYI